jgi:dTDP-L-rhamnose 4-epimerase
VKVLVTGGAGFIGSRIVERLLDQGAAVRVLDRVRRPADSQAEFVQADICDADAVGRAVAGIDAVCHQAAKVGLGVDFGDVTGYVDSNDVGTAVLLKALWRQSFSGRLVLASSMVVYGEGRARCPDHGVVILGARRAEDLEAGRFEPACARSGCRQTLSCVTVGEDSEPDPRNVYAATKLHQEHLCTLWGREAGATVVALRYHNVYGPGMPLDTPYAGVASIFRSALARGHPPLVFEDGGQTRDFVHVDDVARANVLALTGPDVEPGPYNIASGEPHTVAQMADALSSAFGPDAPRPHVTGRWRLGDVRHIVASSEKAAAQLGFKAKVAFEDGMAEFALAPAQAGSAR